MNSDSKVRYLFVINRAKHPVAQVGIRFRVSEQGQFLARHFQLEAGGNLLGEEELAPVSDVNIRWRRNCQGALRSREFCQETPALPTTVAISSPHCTGSDNSMPIFQETCDDISLVISETG